MKSKVKRSIILSVIIIGLVTLFVFLCNPVEKVKWSIKQYKIEDKVIYSQWNDKFGWRLDYYSNAKSFKLEIFKTFNTDVGTKAISEENNRHRFKNSVNFNKILDEKSELEKVEISPKELSNKYVIGDFGEFKLIDWSSDEPIKVYLWQDKYLIYSINYNYDKEWAIVDICDVDTGKQFVYEHSLEAYMPKNVEVSKNLVEPRYYLIENNLICIYKYYNKLYCAKLV